MKGALDCQGGLYGDRRLENHRTAVIALAKTALNLLLAYFLCAPVWQEVEPIVYRIMKGISVEAWFPAWSIATTTRVCSPGTGFQAAINGPMEREAMS